MDWKGTSLQGEDDLLENPFRLHENPAPIRGDRRLLVGTVPMQAPDTSRATAAKQRPA